MTASEAPGAQNIGTLSVSLCVTLVVVVLIMDLITCLPTAKKLLSRNLHWISKLCHKKTPNLDKMITDSVQPFSRIPSLQTLSDSVDKNETPKEKMDRLLEESKTATLYEDPIMISQNKLSNQLVQSATLHNDNVLPDAPDGNSSQEPLQDETYRDNNTDGQHSQKPIQIGNMIWF